MKQTPYTTKLPSDSCPHCGKVLDRALQMKGYSPSEGSVSICIRCANVSLFGENLRLRKPTDEELTSLRSMPVWAEIERHQTAIRLVRTRSDN